MKDDSPFVTTDWLFNNLEQPDIRIVDASWHMPNAARDAAAEFEKAHIPGAVYFDLDRIADTASDLPHMVAAPEDFAAMVGELGISDTDTIVIYDSVGLFSAARVWWNFRIMGANNCFVLEGGLPAWQNKSYPVGSGAISPEPTLFNALPDIQAVVGIKEMQRHCSINEEGRPVQIVDVRPRLRFTGEQAEPRPGLKSGCMPGSINLPFSELVTGGTMQNREAVLSALRCAGINPDEPIISSCGSGVTAPILNLALATLGIDAMRVYDGSWAEWGATAGCPVIGREGQLL